MRPEDLLLWLRAAPFRPFRIWLVSGRSYDIRHPERVRLTRTTAHIYFSNGEPDGPYEHMEMIGLVLIERVEPIDGKQKGRRKPKTR